MAVVSLSWRSQHIPVLAQEAMDLLRPEPGQTMVDGTVGGGGHARLLADRVGRGGLVVALDRDPLAIDRVADTLSDLPIKLIHADFCNLPEVLRDLGIATVDGILLDLGLSSDQLSDSDRGFSFDSTGPLDLRFDPSEGEPAWRLIKRLGADQLAELLYTLGQERYSRRIARKIVSQRGTGPIRTAQELAKLVRSCVPRRSWQRIDPATRTFQALRIAVNHELESLETALRRMPACLRPGGRLAVISFHSLEDRLVKSAFRQDARYEIITRKPIRPQPQERLRNPRSRSGRLRVAQRSDKGCSDAPNLDAARITSI